jgi:CheY-like chemotaxis protein
VSYRILVVEDNPLNAELLMEWLKAEGYEAESAADLKSSYSAAERLQPQAILLDVQLGDEDGLVLAAWVRKHPVLNNIPVIAVTAHAMATERQNVLRSGCNAFVPKPIDFHLLQEQLNRWLPPFRSPNSSE